MMAKNQSQRQNINYLLNSLAPRAIRDQVHALDLGDRWARVYEITDYPPVVGPAWLARAANLPGVTLSVHGLPTDSLKLTQAMSRSISLNTGNLQTAGSSPLVIQRTQAQIEDAESLMRKLDQEQQSVFIVGVFLLVTAETEEIGLRRAKRVEQALAAAGMRARTLSFLQEDGLKSVGPWGLFPKILRGDIPNQMPSETIAASFPFSSGGLNHGRGAFWGKDSDKGVVLVDIWDPPTSDIVNMNIGILAPSGGGKSVGARAFILREWQMGAKIIAVDPVKREFQHMCHRVGGSWINAGGGDTKINPYQAPVIPVPQDPEAAAAMGKGLSSIATHILRVQTFHQLLLPDLTLMQRALLEEATEAIYQQAGITLDTDSSNVPAKEWPHIGHLHKFCKEQTGEDWRILTAALRGPAEGVISQIWAGPSTVRSTAEADFVVLDIQDLAASPDHVKRAQFFNVLTYALDLIRNDRADRKILAVDEAWLLVDHRNPQALTFMKEVSKVIRGYNGSFLVITQNIADFMHEAIRGDGEQVLTNLSYVLLLRQGPKDLEVLAKLFTLSEEEQSRLSGAKIGEGLLIAGNKRVWLTIDIAPYEWEYIGGKPKQSGDEMSYQSYMARMARQEAGRRTMYWVAGGLGVTGIIILVVIVMFIILVEVLSGGIQGGINTYVGSAQSLPASYLNLVDQAGGNLPNVVVLADMQVESGGQANSTNYNLSNGKASDTEPIGQPGVKILSADAGLMQINSGPGWPSRPKWDKVFGPGQDPYDPAKNIAEGEKELYWDTLQNGGYLSEGLSAYNTGSGTSPIGAGYAGKVLANITTYEAGPEADCWATGNYSGQTNHFLWWKWGARQWVQPYPKAPTWILVSGSYAIPYPGTAQTVKWGPPLVPLAPPQTLSLLPLSLPSKVTINGQQAQENPPGAPIVPGQTVWGLQVTSPGMYTATAEWDWEISDGHGHVTKYTRTIQAPAVTVLPSETTH